MAPHSSILAWRIPWTEDLGEDRGPLQSMGSQPDMTEHALTRTSPRGATVGELRKDSKALPKGRGGFSRIPQSLDDHVSDGKRETSPHAYFSGCPLLPWPHSGAR